MKNLNKFDNHEEDLSEESQIYKYRITNLAAQRTGRRTTLLLKKREREVYRRLLFVLIIAVFLVIFLVVFGLQILVKIAEFLDVVRNTGGITQTSDDTIPPFPPRIDTLPSATNSAQLNLTGVSEAGTEVEVSVNNKAGDKTTAEDNGSFSFKNITLKDGENKIEVVSTDRAGNKSQPGSPIVIVYDKTTPFLEIYEPANNLTFSGQSREIRVKGKTEAESTVTVNGSLAIVNSEGEFNTSLFLNEGENQIQIEATDPAGNKSKTSRTVRYQP